jgi:hypothetical protein
MSTAGLLLATAVLLPAVALAAWTLRAMARADEELRHFVNFEGMHFEE